MVTYKIDNIDASVSFQDQTDITKKATFDISPISTGTIRTISLPDANTTLVGTDISQVLTNKTIDAGSNTITNLTNSDVGLANVPNLKVKLDATLAPTVNEDSLDGYSVGSVWINITADKAYICLDASNGAAIWTETTQAAASGVSRKLDTYYSPVTETTVETTWTDVPLTVNRIIDADFTHTVGSAEITINTTDTYLIMFKCSAYISSGNSRSNCQNRLVLDTGSGYTEVAGSFGFTYHRNQNNGEFTSTTPIILSLNSGDKLKGQIVKIAGTSTIKLLTDSCSMVITKA